MHAIYKKTTMYQHLPFFTLSFWSNFPKCFPLEWLYRNIPEGMLPTHSFSLQWQISFHKLNAQSCYGSVSWLHLYQEYGNIPDNVLWTPSINSCGKWLTQRLLIRARRRDKNHSNFFPLDIPISFSGDIFKDLYIVI